MPNFKVTASKTLWPVGHNPFKTKFKNESAKVNTSIKTWEFEAANEDEVQRLFAEAQEAGVTEVFGYRLSTMELVPNAQGNSPASTGTDKEARHDD